MRYMFERVLSFAALVVILTAIPGPAVVLIMKSSVLHGRRSAVTTALGVSSGGMIWVTASLAGLTAILVAYRPAFEVLRFAGAAYLVYLGLRLLLRRSGSAVVSEISPRTAGRTGRKAFGDGVLCELSNPKTLIVFTSVIAQFVSSSGGVAELAVFGVLFAVIAPGSSWVYALVFSASRRVVRRPVVAQVLLRASGGVLVIFGGALAVERLRSV